jgi:nucleotide-binding universal stress UspA family protein
MYTKILVALDESSIAEQVLPYARFLAKSLKLPVELITAIDVTAAATSYEIRDFHAFVRDIRGASEAYLERIAKTFSGTSITASVQIGKPAEVIIKKATRDKRTLIAMATHGRSGISRWLLGSVAEKVLRATSNPLLLVRAGEIGKAEGELNIERIVVPLDTSALAENVLRDVTELAKKLNLEIMLAHAYVTPLSPYYGAGDHYNPHYKSLATQLKDEARKYLQGKVRKLKGKGLEKTSCVFLEGSPAEEIIALTRREPNSLLAMCTHGRSGVKRWVLGSVTEKVVRHSADPVLVLRAS